MNKLSESGVAVEAPRVTKVEEDVDLSTIESPMRPKQDKIEMDNDLVRYGSMIDIRPEAEKGLLR